MSNPNKKTILTKVKFSRICLILMLFSKLGIFVFFLISLPTRQAPGMMARGTLGDPGRVRLTLLALKASSVVLTHRQPRNTKF